ncbi:MAG: DUF4962 domain-containing protein [Fimbriimonadaceae bacterium]|nr:DUF4962 domain-containing protein [Fimbriimonadaceae bacterium]
MPALTLLLSLLPLAAEPAGSWTFEADAQGWRPRAASLTVGREAGGRAGSAGALRVRGPIREGFNYASGPQFGLVAGQLYRLSAWLRVDRVGEGTPGPFLKCELQAGPTETLGRVNTNSYELTRLGQWQQLEVEFKAPARAVLGWLAIEKGTAEAEVDLLLDDVRVELIPRLSALERYALTPPAALQAVRRQHPRLYFTAAGLTALQARLTGDLRPTWERLRPTLERYAASPPPAYRAEPDGSGDEQLWQREVGNAMPYLALGWAVTREQRYLDAAGAWALASCSYPTWGLKGIDGMDLATGHQTFGLATIYDWCYADLPAATRQTIRETLLRRGGRQFEAAATGAAWWQKSYLQNHLWVNLTGLAAAGLALFDEAPETLQWVGLAREKYRQTWTALGSDGASHEGVGYWGYGVEYLLKYLALARDLLGEELYDHPWWRQTAAYRLYASLPRAAWTRANHVVDLADCPRTNWYGPEFLLRRLAAEYRDPVAQWLALQVEESNTSSASAQWLNLLWHDPSLVPRPPTALPTLRHFADLGLVSARSDWSGTESLLFLRCGPPLGHEARGKFPHDPGSGHVHPDLNHFVLFGAGSWLLRDDGYAAKWTKQHNTLLVNGQGQLGEGQLWFDGSAFLNLNPGPRVLRAASTPEVDWITADATVGYPKAAGLRRFVRHWLFVKPQALLVLDDIETAAPADLTLHFFPEQPLQGGAPVFEGAINQARLRIASLTPGAAMAFEPVGGEDRHGGQGQTRAAVVLRQRGTRWRQITALTWSPAAQRPTAPSLTATDPAATIQIGERRLEWRWDPGEYSLR